MPQVSRAIITEHNKTIIETNIQHAANGYLSNIPIVGKARQDIATLQNRIESIVATSGVLWAQPADSLHITAFDFIAPQSTCS